MRLFLAWLLMVSPALGQSILDKSDLYMDRADVRQMIQGVLEAMGSGTAYFYALGYRTGKEGEDRNVICGIVGRAGEYAFYHILSKNETVLLPKEMGRGGRDVMMQQLSEIGCTPPI